MAWRSREIGRAYVTYDEMLCPHVIRYMDSAVLFHQAVALPTGPVARPLTRPHVVPQAAWHHIGRG